MKILRIIIFTITLVIILPVLSFALSLGPYSGSVVDSQTGEPIEGASVLFYWTKSVFQVFESKSELIKAELIYTDTGGRYTISKFIPNLGLLAALELTNVIIYQPGYQACIVKIWHDTHYSNPAPSFREKDNIVKLDRIPPKFSHRKHYEDIEHALWGIDDYPYAYPQENDKWITWDRLLETNLKGGPEKAELLRRAEWEERRGRLEERK